MRTPKKITLSAMLAATLVAGSVAGASFAQEADATTWSFDEVTGTLTIEGVGEMPSFDLEGGVLAPWHDPGYVVKKVVIADGVTGIGDYAFCELRCLESVEVPDSLTSIGKGAFSDCFSLDSFGYGNNAPETAHLKAAVASVGEDAFYGCSKMRNVYLEATDLRGYRFDTLADDMTNRYDFNNPGDTMIHVAKGFGEHITLDQCEALYQWERAAGDKVHIMADLDVDGTVIGDRGQQAEAAKGASAKKAEDTAAEAGVKATSAEARELAAEQAIADAEARDAAAAAKAATTPKAEDAAAAAGEQAAEVQAISESNRRYHASVADTDHRQAAAAARVAERCGKASSEKEAAAEAEKGEKALHTSGTADDAPKKRDNNRPGLN